ASVTVKIASISFIVTTSSIDADLGGARRDLPPRLVVDRDPAGAPLARGALLGLARDQDFLGTAGQRRRAHEAEERGDLRVKVARRQEAPGIDAHHQDAVAHRALVRARGLVAKPSDIATVALGPGTATACGLVPRRRAAPPQGATFSAVGALTHSIPISPCTAAISA